VNAAELAANEERRKRWSAGNVARGWRVGCPSCGATYTVARIDGRLTPAPLVCDACGYAIPESTPTPG
jgi:predicted RNA-binding Zn-ribbon protein involved in translation (DUF1610 family)